MTELLVDPQIVTTVAANIDGIGSSIKAATAAAAAPTSGVLAAAADEVSAAIANLFGAHGQEFQAVVNQVEAYQTQFQQKPDRGGERLRANRDRRRRRSAGSAGGARRSGGGASSHDPALQSLNRRIHRPDRRADTSTGSMPPSRIISTSVRSERYPTSSTRPKSCIR